MRNNIKLLIGVILCLLAFNHQGVLSGRVNSSHDGEGESWSVDSLDRLASIITDVKKYYYKPLDDKTLLNHAISGMLSSLDPHSSYLTLEDLKELEMETIGKFGGIGVEVIPAHGAIRVIAPVDDTPAYKAGIKAGDYIIRINKKLVRDMTLKDAISMMRGKKGTCLILTIVRKNVSKPLVFNLRREIIKIQTVKSRVLEPRYGYVRVAYFQEPTERDMVRAIRKMQRESKGKLKGLVLDLRSNPGGLLISAVKIANDFLDARILKNNNLIVYTKGQVNESQISAKATVGDLVLNIPMVVLINEGSASAAEVVAGALQDHKRAIIVGVTSFGKGSVQTLIPIDKTGAIKLTTALYYTPLGRSIQAKGIEPDINVEDIQLSRDGNKDQEIPRIDESALIDHIENGGEDGDSKSVSRLEKQQTQSKTELELAYTDYQLYEALHILKSQNVIRQQEE
ncbi:MAG: S41 family peptidase [Coxiellaceae bacterium]|jgi:carboxyl-terminal processing protease|nr:S41 family peptidase [Coxiellaceae bacterium]